MVVVSLSVLYKLISRPFNLQSKCSNSNIICPSLTVRKNGTIGFLNLVLLKLNTTDRLTF